MTVAQPSMSGNGKVELSWSVKLLLALSTLLSTVVATGIGAFITNYYVERQAETSAQQADVRRLEDVIQSSDVSMRVFVAGANKGKPSESAREAVISSFEQQYALAERLIPLADSDDRRASVIEYQAALLKIIKRLRRSNDNASVMELARAVSAGIDARVAAVDSLRGAVGLPVAGREADAKEAVRNFGSATNAY